VRKNLFYGQNNITTTVYNNVKNDYIYDKLYTIWSQGKNLKITEIIKM